eukprot:809598-Pleurochrysis_carterae.AAC.1
MGNGHLAGTVWMLMSEWRGNRKAQMSGEWHEMVKVWRRCVGASSRARGSHPLDGFCASGGSRPLPLETGKFVVADGLLPLVKSASNFSASSTLPLLSLSVSARMVPGFAPSACCLPLLRTTPYAPARLLPRCITPRLRSCW